jgi:hypothetical protein
MAREFLSKNVGKMPLSNLPSQEMSGEYYQGYEDLVDACSTCAPQVLAPPLESSPASPASLLLKRGQGRIKFTLHSKRIKSTNCK